MISQLIRHTHRDRGKEETGADISERGDVVEASPDLTGVHPIAEIMPIVRR